MSLSHEQWIFYGITGSEKVLSTKAAFIALLNLSIIRLSLRTKTTWSNSNPVQISRSVLMTCQEKGCLLRFESNRAATSDGSVQKLQKQCLDVRRNSESIAIKVCSQKDSKWNVMFKSHVVTSIDRTSFDFLSEDFLSNLPLLLWPTIHDWISRICTKFQMISSHFFKVNKLLYEH